MWSKPGDPVSIDSSQLRVGLYISLRANWNDHPFLYNDFRIRNQKQIDIIQEIGIREILYFPDKSTVEPGPRDEAYPAPASSPEHTAPTAVAPPPAVQRYREEKRSRISKEREAAILAERGWERAAKATREALLGLSRHARQSGEQLAAFSKDTATAIAEGKQVLLHLLGDKTAEGPQFHALNVMTLSMVLGKLIGMSEAQLADLALGAVAHDAGKSQIPAHILKSKTRAKHEESFYRDHVKHGLVLAQSSGAFRREALAVIAEHHELLDGNGFPQGIKPSTPGGRIVGLVDRYDRLCCPESPDKEPMMPTEALAWIFRNERDRYDPQLLSQLIKVLGVYPPGTVVQLSDGALGLVVSPGKDSLRPTVLIYNPDLPKDEAPSVNLADETDLKIEEAIKPSSLPADVVAWLNPGRRLSYFYSIDNQ